MAGNEWAFSVKEMWNRRPFTTTPLPAQDHEIIQADTTASRYRGVRVCPRPPSTGILPPLPPYSFPKPRPMPMPLSMP
jgi:hypothetical protein